MGTPDSKSNLVKLRLAQRLTQADLADALGKTKQSIRNWERGRTEPQLTLRETKLLCKLLGKTLEEMPDDLGRSKSVKRPKQSAITQLTFI